MVDEPAQRSTFCLSHLQVSQSCITVYLYYILTSCYRTFSICQIYYTDATKHLAFHAFLLKAGFLFISRAHTANQLRLAHCACAVGRLAGRRGSRPEADEREETE